MSEVNLTINGRVFGIACDDGQEQRVINLGSYVDARIKDIARAGAANNESHLLVLAAIVLADEIFDLKDEMKKRSNGFTAKSAIKAPDPEDEAAIIQAIDHLASRINSIAGNIQKL